MFNDALYLSIEKQDNSDIKLQEKRNKINMAQFMSLSLNYLGIIERNFSRPIVPWLLFESSPFRMYFRSAAAVRSYELVCLVYLCWNRTHCAQLHIFYCCRLSPLSYAIPSAHSVIVLVFVRPDRCKTLYLERSGIFLCHSMKLSSYRCTCLTNLLRI